MNCNEIINKKKPKPIQYLYPPLSKTVMDKTLFVFFDLIEIRFGSTKAFTHVYAHKKHRMRNNIVNAIL